MKSINEEIIEIIRQKTPDKENSVDFLMNILPLGKEAAYRRLRGDVAFSLDESAIICKNLNVSLDLLLGIKQEDTFAFHLDPLFTGNPFDNYCKMLHRIKLSMDYVKSDPTVQLYTAHKTLPQEFLYNYEFLSRVYVYILYYQLHSNSGHKVKSFAEIGFPDDLYTAQKISTASVHDFNSTLILDKRIFIDYIDIVKFFKHLELFTKSDIERIKEELYLLVQDMEKCAAAGLSLSGKVMNFYLSHISFDCSYTSLESENFNVASIGIYCIDYLSSQNLKVNEGQKRWVKSLIRFSTLISVSGELQRNEFFQTQRMYIDAL